MTTKKEADLIEIFLKVLDKNTLLNKPRWLAIKLVEALKQYGTSK